MSHSDVCEGVDTRTIGEQIAEHTRALDRERHGDKISIQELNASVMGKLREDMLFLERMASDPSLKRDLLDPRYRGRGQAGARAGILTTARDGLSFLKVRSSFWETSGNTNTERGQRGKRS